MKTPDLFAGCPEKVKELARAGKKQKREKARREWYEQMKRRTTQAPHGQ